MDGHKALSNPDIDKSKGVFLSAFPSDSGGTNQP